MPGEDAGWEAAKMANEEGSTAEAAITNEGAGSTAGAAIINEGEESTAGAAIPSEGAGSTAEAAITNEEEILRITVYLEENFLVEGRYQTARMITFSGKGAGPYFQGKILPGGVDTQRIEKGAHTCLSARYMMEGTDDKGAHCRLFIENNGEEGADGQIRTTPVIVTDSSSLSWMEEAKLWGTVEGARDEEEKDCVLIRIFRR